MWPFTVRPKSPEAIEPRVRVFDKKAGFYGGRGLLTDVVNPPGEKLFMVNRTIRYKDKQLSRSDFGEIQYPVNVTEQLENVKTEGAEAAPIPFGLRLPIGKIENAFLAFGAEDELIVSGSMIAEEITDIEDEEAFCVQAIAKGIYGALA